MNYALGKFAIAICDICGQRYKLHELNSSEERIIDGILICDKCKRFYPIKDKVPIMLPDNLRNNDKDNDFIKEWEKNIPEEILNDIKATNLKSPK